jgi:hypothetical protein
MSDIANLANVEKKEDLDLLYKSLGLSSTELKIKYLIAAMKIRAMRCEEEETPEENLAGLEEIVLLKHWRASA